MADVTICELRNRGGEVIERVIGGEILTVTRDGILVAQLVPLPRMPLSAEALLERHRGLPPLDPGEIRRERDEIIDPAL